MRELAMVTDLINRTDSLDPIEQTPLGVLFGEQCRSLVMGAPMPVERWPRLVMRAAQQRMIDQQAVIDGLSSPNR